MLRGEAAVRLGTVVAVGACVGVATAAAGVLVATAFAVGRVAVGDGAVVARAKGEFGVVSD